MPSSLRDAAPRRVATYLAGRFCASRALRDAGCTVNPTDIGAGVDGGPLWPRGHVGSISHTDQIALAVVGRSDSVRAVGVDCEHVVPSDEADDIARAVIPEIDDATLVTGDPLLRWEELVTVGFSAKESLYKCLRPLVGTFFDFADAQMTHVDLVNHRLTLRLERSLGPEFTAGTELVASYRVQDGVAATMVILPAGADAAPARPGVSAPPPPTEVA